MIENVINVLKASLIVYNLITIYLIGTHDIFPYWPDF